METPNKFENIEDLPKSSVVEIEEISVWGKSRRETAMLPDY